MGESNSQAVIDREVIKGGREGGERGRVRKAVKTGDGVPDPPNPSKVIDASDATVAARAPIAACIAVASDSAGEDTFMVDASYVDE